MPATRRSAGAPALPIAPITAALAAALLLAAGPLLGRAALADATSWIDAPLDGSVLPLAPVDVVAHSADQAGIAEVIFDVDGADVDAAVQPAAASSRLVTSRFRWVPPGFGTYVLTVRARNPAGELGAPATATVVISEDAIPAPTVDPGASPGASSSPGPSLPPGQSAAPPTSPPGGTPAPTRPQPSVPTATYCPPPTAILDTPNDFVELDYPSEAQPLFEWHYAGGTGCLVSQTIHIYNQVVGIDISVDLGAGARSYQQRSGLPWDPDNPDRSCAHYNWEVTGYNADGDGEPSAGGSFKVCELNPDA